MEKTDLEILLENMNHAQDIPDQRDITTDELFGAVATIEWLPSAASVDLTPFLNQGRIGACTVFGSDGALFNTIAFDAQKNGNAYQQPCDPWDDWAVAKKRGGDDVKGWIIQGALKLQKDLGHSVGYANIGYNGGAVADVMKYWIWKGRAIVTGSTYGDWWKIIQTGIYSESPKMQGHCFQFPKYDDNQVIGDDIGGFYCPNSWGGRGAFWISYKQIKSLFTQYITLWPADLQVLEDLKNKRTQEYLAKTSKIWNGKNPEDIATPYEIATMVNRAMNVLWNAKRRKYMEMFTDHILRGTGVVQISNGTDMERVAKDQEIAVMFTNAVTRKPYTKLVLKRIQVATVIGRDFL